MALKQINSIIFVFIMFFIYFIFDDWCCYVITFQEKSFQK